jgi:hypothetical protein
MLPTLAERLRKQARSRRRGQTRQPWPVPGDPPTALLFRPQPAHPAHEDASPPEPAAVEVPAAESAVAVAELTVPAEPPAAVVPEPRSVRAPLPEGLLLLLWALLVVIDGALALSALLRRDDSRQPRLLGTTASAAASTAPTPCRGPDPSRALLALSSPT